MNYKIEICSYWAILTLITYHLFIKAEVRLTTGILKWSEQTMAKEWTAQSMQRLGKIKQWITAILILFYVATILFLALAPIYPTYLTTTPVVRITEKGDIIPLPFITWKWNIPNGNTYVRLTKNVPECNLSLTGMTEDGIALGPRNLPKINFRFIDHTAFYYHYKTAGVDGFCNDVQTIMNQHIFYGKTILANSEENKRDSEDKFSGLKQRLIAIFAHEFSSKGVIPFLD